MTVEEQNASAEGAGPPAQESDEKTASSAPAPATGRHDTTLTPGLFHLIPLEIFIKFNVD
jgi:hypothetical protein